MPANIVDVNDANFDQEVVKSDLPVLVDFWAAWCGPCRAIAPVVEQVAEEYDGKLKVAKLNVDQNPQVATEYRIRSIPSLLLFKDGQVAGQLVGAVPKNRLVDFVSRVM